MPHKTLLIEVISGLIVLVVGAFGTWLINTLTSGWVVHRLGGATMTDVHNEMMAMTKSPAATGAYDLVMSRNRIRQYPNTTTYGFVEALCKPSYKPAIVSCQIDTYNNGAQLVDANTHDHDTARCVWRFENEKIPFDTYASAGLLCVRDGGDH